MPPRSLAVRNVPSVGIMAAMKSKTVAMVKAVSRVLRRPTRSAIDPQSRAPHDSPVYVMTPVNVALNVIEMLVSPSSRVDSQETHFFPVSLMDRHICSDGASLASNHQSKARQKSDRIGSERRLPTFLCQTFRNSENPRTHKDVFHLGLSL